MADRHVLLVDTDKNFQETLRRALTPYGVEVVVVDDGSDGIARAREVSPELMVIAVEMPKREGYGIFSKARKSLSKKMPIALVTSSVSPEDFAKHQKLNTHADEYVDKRAIDNGELVRRIDRLIQLGPPQSDGDELELNVEDAEEFAIEEDIAVVDEVQAGDEGEADPPTNAGDYNEDATRISSGLVDEGIDAETEAAFAALGMGEEGGFDGEDGSTELHRGIDTRGLTLGGAEPRAASSPGQDAVPKPMPEMVKVAMPAAQVKPATPPPEADGTGEYDLGLDAVAEHAAEDRADEQAKDDAREESGRTDPAGARINELEAERDKLRKELDELRASGGGGAPAPFSREREFKSLREMISRKEKELDDLKEEIETRDKQILGGKEKLKELNNKLKETEERLLNMQEELVTANAGVSTLSAEKEKGLERERGLKARLEISQTDARKAHEEIDALRKKLAADHAAADAALAREKADHEKALKDAAAESQRVAAAHAAALAKLQEDLEGQQVAAIGAIEADRAEQLERLKNEQAAAQLAMREEHDGEIAALHTANEDALARKDRERRDALQRAAEEREKALNAAEERRLADLRDAEEKRIADLAVLTEQKNGELAAQAEANRVATAALEKKHEGELAAAEARRVADLAAAEARRVKELAEADDKYSGEIGGLQASFDADRAETAEKHAGELAVLRQEIAELQTALAGARAAIVGLEGDVQTHTGTIAQREQAIAGLQTVVSDREAAITSLKRDIEDLETQATQFQEQILKAYNKIKSDEATVAKAKKAMAIALTLLDEQEGGGGTAVS